MSVKSKETLFKKLKYLTEDISYPLSDLELIETINAIISSIKLDEAKDKEHLKNFESRNLKAVDEVMKDEGWQNYCSDKTWADQDFIDSQKRKGLIKEFKQFNFNRK